jgi:hypothetical protein
MKSLGAAGILSPPRLIRMSDLTWSVAPEEQMAAALDRQVVDAGRVADPPDVAVELPVA